MQGSQGSGHSCQHPERAYTAESEGLLCRVYEALHFTREQECLLVSFLSSPSLSEDGVRQDTAESGPQHQTIISKCCTSMPLSVPIANRPTLRSMRRMSG